MNPDNAIQILGVIVQTYGGILAIGAGFFTFLVQRFRDEMKTAEERIEKNVDIIATIFSPYGMLREATNFKVGAIAHGPEWIEKELKRVHHRGDRMFRLQPSAGHLRAIKNLRKEYPRYKKLKQKSEKVPYRLFSGFMLFCSIVIILSLVVMGLIDVWFDLKIANQVVWFIEGLASAGVIYVSVFAWTTTVVFR
jgi:hypothetical protein